MALQIWSGAARVIETGTVVTFLGAPLWFEIDVDLRKFAVQVIFVTDADGGELSVKSELHPNFLNLELHNFDGPDGRGSAEPVLIGEVGEDLVFLHFRVFRRGRSGDRDFLFTFYRAPRSRVPVDPVLVYAEKGG
jgi:hypothetical protein